MHRSTLRLLGLLFFSTDDAFGKESEQEMRSSQADYCLDYIIANWFFTKENSEEEPK